MKKFFSVVAVVLSTLLFVGCQAPKAEISVSETKIFVGESVTFDASKSSDVDGDISTYEWTDAEGKVLSTEIIFTKVFEVKGTYKITLAVTDDKNLRSEATVVITVEDQLLAPEATIEVSSSTIFEGENITFDASKSIDTDGEITGYLWTDSEGSVLSTEMIFTKEFTKVGTQTIRLVLTDDSNLSAEANVTVTVNAVIPPATCPTAKLEVTFSDIVHGPVGYTVTLSHTTTSSVAIEFSTGYYLNIWIQGWVQALPTYPEELNIVLAPGTSSYDGKLHLTYPEGDPVDEKGYVIQLENVTCSN